MKYSAAKTYILRLLKRELPSNLHYHGLHHTWDVYNSAKLIALNEGITEHESKLLLTAALFHDTGYIKSYLDNESIAIDLVKEILPNSIIIILYRDPVQQSFSLLKQHKNSRMSLNFRKRDYPKSFMLENTVFTNLTFWGRRPSIKAQTLIGGVPDRAHSYLVYNLLFDPEEMIKLDDKQLLKKMTDGSNRISEIFDGSKSKVLLNESYCFKDSKFAEVGIDTLRQRAKFINQNEDFSSRLIKLHIESQKMWPEPIFIEERIFEKFPSAQDKKTMISFHTAPNSKKYEISKQFQDNRYQELAIRILYEIAPQTIPEIEKQNYEFEIKERFNEDDKSKWNSKNRILKQLETDVENMIENEEEKILFKQRVVSFLNAESAKWS